jgi:hypothetical protein
MYQKTQYEQASQLSVQELWPYNCRLDRVMEAYMETVLFTDQDILVFVITATALALVFSVLGLATPRRTRADIQQQLNGMR